MDFTPQRKRMRAILDGSRCVRPASVFDPVSARIAEMVGFEVGMYAGSLGALSVMAAPERTPSGEDLSIITISEFSEQARRICRATALPVMADADNGYGNALNVMRAVEELESAGIALVLIEDTELPAQFGRRGNSLISIAEMVGKLRAALRARQDSNLIVAGRTRAARSDGVKEMIERGRAYEATGVDALWYTSITSEEQVETIAAALQSSAADFAADERGNPCQDLRSRFSCEAPGAHVFARTPADASVDSGGVRHDERLAVRRRAGCAEESRIRGLDGTRQPGRRLRGLDARVHGLSGAQTAIPAAWRSMRRA